MAKAELIPPLDPYMRLELTREEAEYLHDLLYRRVYGSGPGREPLSRIRSTMTETNPSLAKFTPTNVEGGVRYGERKAP